MARLVTYHLKPNTVKGLGTEEVVASWRKGLNLLAMKGLIYK